jgi:hypothetical protein
MLRSGMTATSSGRGCKTLLMDLLILIVRTQHMKDYICQVTYSKDAAEMMLTGRHGRNLPENCAFSTCVAPDKLPNSSMWHCCIDSCMFTLTIYQVRLLIMWEQTLACHDWTFFLLNWQSQSCFDISTNVLVLKSK